MPEIAMSGTPATPTGSTGDPEAGIQDGTISLALDGGYLFSDLSFPNPPIGRQWKVGRIHITTDGPSNIFSYVLVSAREKTRFVYADLRATLEGPGTFDLTEPISIAPTEHMRIQSLYCSRGALVIATITYDETDYLT